MKTNLPKRVIRVRSGWLGPRGAIRYDVQNLFGPNAVTDARDLVGRVTKDTPWEPVSVEVWTAELTWVKGLPS